MSSSRLPRRFALQRHEDTTGVSGVGLVAYGTVYPTGRTTLAWCCSDISSVTVYDSPEQVVQVHGHGGSTDFVWIDDPESGETVGQGDVIKPRDGAGAESTGCPAS